MLTHYVKRAGTSRLVNQVESTIYAAIPEGRMVVLDEILERVRAFADKARERAPVPKLIESTVEDLVARGFLVQIHGTRLERFIATL